jgi:hypothetical protein
VVGIRSVVADVAVRAGPVEEALAAPAGPDVAQDRAALVVDDLGDARRQPDIAEADPVAAAVVDEAEPVERVIAVVGDRAARRRAA